MGAKVKFGSAILGACLATLCSFASVSAATLLGDTVTVQISSTTGNSVGSTSAVVGAGTDITLFGNQFLDFNGGPNGDLFTISSLSNFGGIFTIDTNQILTWTLSSLDFGVPLIGFNVTQSLDAVTINSITPTSVTFSYHEAAIPSGNYFTAQFVTGAAPVPGPTVGAGASSFALAALFFGWLVRRRGHMAM